MNVANYSLLLINPMVERLDSVVVGAVFRRSTGWDVRVASDTRKMKAVNPSFPESRLIQTHNLISEYASTADDVETLRQYFVGAKFGILLDEFIGSFSFESEDDYQRQVNAVLAESVNPPTISMVRAAPVSRRRDVVRRKLRDQFQNAGLWSRKAGDIERHRVVEQYPISKSHGVIADFALKNSVMHITETIDFEIQNLKSKKLEAQAKTLVLSEAKKVFGVDTKCYVVAAGSANPDIKQSVLLLSDYADIYALESHTEMTAYLDKISQAANSER